MQGERLARKEKNRGGEEGRMREERRKKRGCVENEGSRDEGSEWMEKRGEVEWRMEE